jgi:hypothetical protein
MKRTVKYALTAVLASVMVVPAMAQDNFPDVPDNHWAFEALAKMKREGILVGYPDGLFRGGRPASRYELAVAINAAYTNLKNITDGLNTQIAELKRMSEGNGGPRQDLQPLREALTALQNEVNTLKGMGDDVANLRKMADTFQRELQQLGVDVEAMKRDLGDLADRVTALENKKPAVDISGDVNLFVAAGNSRDRRYGLDKDGRINGTNNGQNPNLGSVTGLTEDVTILHEGAFTLAGTNTEGPQWRGTLVVGNMLADASATTGLPTTRRAFGNQSQLQTGFGYAEATSDVYLQDFSVKFTTALAGLGFNAEVGRVGYKVNPYILQRIDNTSYFENERWDNGEYTFDGAILGFNLGGAKVDVFGGRNSKRFSTNGVEINPLVSGTVGGTNGAGVLTIDRSLGINANIPLTSAGNLNLAYLWLDQDNGTSVLGSLTPVNRLNILGGQADFNIGRIKLEGGFFQTNLMQDDSSVIDNDNTAFFAGGAITLDKFNLFARYREVEANYVAPGDWGRLGVMRNPVNIRGAQVGGSYDVTSGIAIKAMGEFYEGLDNAYAATSSFGEGTTINKFSVDVAYKVNPNFSVFVGYEDTEFKDLFAPAKAITGNPRYRWTTFGVGYGLSDAAKLTIQYQISDIENEYQVLSTANTRFTGGLLTTQLSVKF